MWMIKEVEIVEPDKVSRKLSGISEKLASARSMAQISKSRVEVDLK
jgi:hypothetical protein